MVMGVVLPRELTTTQVSPKLTLATAVDSLDME